jgi:hypothetical protein
MGNCFARGICIKRYANLDTQKIKTKKKEKISKSPTNNIHIIENYIDTKNDNHKLDELIKYLDSNIIIQPHIRQPNTPKAMVKPMNESPIETNSNKIIKYNTFIITRRKKINIKRLMTI